MPWNAVTTLGSTDMPTLALLERTLERLNKVPAEDFKALFIDYIMTNECDVDWQGFTQRDLYGFGAVLRDFLLAYETGGLEDGKITCRLCGDRFKERGMRMHEMRTHHL
jgi:hypothetical protein